METEYRYEENIQTLTVWELEISDIIQAFYKVCGFNVVVIKNEDGSTTLKIVKTEKALANEEFVNLINFYLTTENKLSALSDTEKEIMKNHAKEISKTLAKTIFLNKSKFGIKDTSTAQFLILSASKLFYQLAMKSVEGGERAYRGKIIKETITAKPEEKKVEFKVWRQTHIFYSIQKKKQF